MRKNSGSQRRAVILLFICDDDEWIPYSVHWKEGNGHEWIIAIRCWCAGMEVEVICCSCFIVHIHSKHNIFSEWQNDDSKRLSHQQPCPIVTRVLALRKLPRDGWNWSFEKGKVAMIISSLACHRGWYRIYFGVRSLRLHHTISMDGLVQRKRRLVPFHFYPCAFRSEMSRLFTPHTMVELCRNNKVRYVLIA